jgi:quercetin dioxygenase-like cupin family protein
MLVRHVSEVKQSKVETEGAVGVNIRWLISKEEGAPSFAMREFEIEPAGHTPYHSHAWEHEVFGLAGEGVVVSADAETPIKPGMAVFVPGGQMHNFKNTGSETLRFLCLIPHNS